MNKKDLILIEKEIKGCFDYFWNMANLDPSSNGYGFILDRTGHKVVSIAAMGFAFPAYIIGVKNGYITYEEAYDRTLKTLKNINNYIPHDHGFLAHFVYMDTVKMKQHTEYSTIDTSILLMGAITASEFFGGDIKDEVMKLYDRVDWDYIIDDVNGKTQFLMAMFPDNKDYNVHWDHYAEQLMMYILYAGSKNADPLTARKLYYDFERNVGSYKGDNFIYCFSNSLFIHQFTHAFFDFSKYLDERGCDWYKNSVDATIANRRYCIDQKGFKTFSESSWGLTAVKAKDGYFAYGSKPNGFLYDFIEKIDGTVGPYAAISSIVFTPKESLEALRYFSSLKKLQGEYGFYDSFNLDQNWYSRQYLGIDKGLTIIMLDNYLNGTTYEYFMKSNIALKAIEVLHFKKKEN